MYDYAFVTAFGGFWGSQWSRIWILKSNFSSGGGFGRVGCIKVIRQNRNNIFAYYDMTKLSLNLEYSQVQGIIVPCVSNNLMLFSIAATETFNSSQI